MSKNCCSLETLWLACSIDGGALEEKKEVQDTLKLLQGLLVPRNPDLEEDFKEVFTLDNIVACMLN